MSTEVYLNDFATRSFRDTADQDYIAARASFRARLFPQFHWSGLQAIEKYLKAILLYNRIPQPQGQYRLGHDLGRALELTKALPFTLSVTDASREIIEHLDTYGRFRYLETPYHIRDRELLKLDRAVWEIRRYCRVINYRLEHKGKPAIDMLPVHLKEIEQSEFRLPQKFRIVGGALEKILMKKDHPARPSLVWKNMFFNSHSRKGTWWRQETHFVNSPLALRPEILDEVRKYVWLPKEVIKAYQESAGNSAGP